MDSVSSTNDALKKLDNSYEISHGYYVSTDYQTSGRGQVGNSWLADAGQNLLMSVLIRPNSLGMDRYFYLNMSVCLSVLDALSGLHHGFRVKWPNDILFDRSKIAGILIENSISNNLLKRAVVGMGININQRSFPLNLNLPGISMRQVMGRSLDVNYIRDQLFHSLNQRLDQLETNPQSILDQYHQHLYGYGESVRAKVDGVVGDILVTEVSGDGTLHTIWQGRSRKFQFRELQFLP